MSFLRATCDDLWDARRQLSKFKLNVKVGNSNKDKQKYKRTLNKDYMPHFSKASYIHHKYWYTTSIDTKPFPPQQNLTVWEGSL